MRECLCKQHIVTGMTSSIYCEKFRALKIALSKFRTLRIDITAGEH